MLDKPFFIEDKFYSEVDDLIEELEQDYDCEIKDIPEDWSAEIEVARYEPVFKVRLDRMVYLLVDAYISEDNERVPDDETWNDVQRAFMRGIDADTINANMPSLYYGTGEYHTITKKDLLC